MENKQILEKAMQKAIDGGWKPSMLTKRLEMKLIQPWKFTDYRITSDYWYTAEELIFNHDFARALWGEDFMKVEPESFGNVIGKFKWWQYHLQKMAIADDPIAYLGEHI